MQICTPAWYYRQQDANYSLKYPGEGYTGWSKLDATLDLDHTAVIVMHAWGIPPYEECPGVYHVCEYINRSNQIMANKFPAFLEAARKNAIRVIHVGEGTEDGLASIPGYQRTVQKFGTTSYPQINMDAATKHLWNQIYENGLCSKENQRDFKRLRKEFAIRPLDHEDVACTADQLFGLCQEHEISHLIYTGFCVNACLTFSSCGFVDMVRRGLLCSIVADLTTAVENKESCRDQQHLQYGLWQFASNCGLVFQSGDLMEAFKKLQ